MPGHARLPGVVVVVVGVPRLVLQRGPQVLDAVGHVGVVDLLRPALADDLGGERVGHDDEVPAGRHAGRQGGRDGGEERRVVVDLLFVVDLDAVLLLEVDDRGGRTGGVVARVGGLAGEVDVGAPVGELEGTRDGLRRRRHGGRGAGRRRRGDDDRRGRRVGGGRLGRPVPPAQAARKAATPVAPVTCRNRRRVRPAVTACSCDSAMELLLLLAGIGHSGSPAPEEPPVSWTTNEWSGDQVSWTSSPGAHNSERVARSTFCS